jgi:hypothetical protein
MLHRLPIIAGNGEEERTIQAAYTLEQNTGHHIKSLDNNEWAD